MSFPKSSRDTVPAVGLAILLALIVALSLATPADAARTVLSSGHVDGINPVLEDGELRVTVRDDTGSGGAVVREVDDVLVHGGSAHHRNIPGSGFYDFGFLDHPSGKFWHLPANNQPGKLFIGWGAESPTLRDGGGASRFEGPLRFSLVDHEGPGYFHLYQLGDEEVDILASSVDLAGVSNSWTEPIPTHVHANWAFSEPGIHKLSFRVAGTLKDGRNVSDVKRYRFFVDDPTGIDLADLPDLEVSGLDQRYEIGGQVSLAATQSPSTTQDHYHWFKRCDGGWQYINPSLSDTLELTLTEDLVDCEIQARLYDGEHVVIATSDPETLRSTQPNLTITGLERHYHPGDQLALGLEFDPAEDHPHVHWYQRSGGGDWVEVGGGTTLVKSLTLADDGSQIKAVQGHGEDGYESQAVTLRVVEHHHDPGDDPGKGDPGPKDPGVGPPGQLRASLKVLGPKRFSQIRRQKAFRVRLGANAAARATIRAVVSRKVARRAGLKVPARARTVVIGSVKVNRRAAGNGGAVIRLKPAAARRLGKVRVGLRVRFLAQVKSHDGRSARARAAITLRR